MAEYGINIFGMSEGIHNEQLIEIVASYYTHDVNFKNGWYTIDGIPPGTPLDGILTFCRAGYAKFQDKDTRRWLAFGGGRHDYAYSHADLVLLPIKIRVKGGKYQIRLTFTDVELFMGILGMRDSGWENKRPSWETFLPYNGTQYSTPPKEVKIDLKFGIFKPKVDTKELPEYGIAVFKENGDCIYANHISSIIQDFRTIYVDKADAFKYVFQNNEWRYNSINIENRYKLNDGEYVLLNNLGEWDQCYWHRAGQRGNYAAGVINLGVDHNLALRTEQREIFHVEAGKFNWTGIGGNREFISYKFTNKNILVAKLS